jgi:FixJ family two-component response regulator
LAPPQRVLVVDDEAYYRDTIRDALALEEIACEGVASRAELLKAIEDPRLACVVLDIDLAAPEPSALFEALFEQRPDLRLIALATQNDQERVLESLRLGACDYLAKPIHDEELCLAVRRALGVEASLSRARGLRTRLVSLADYGDAVERALRADLPRDHLAARIAMVAAEVLGARRATLLRVGEDGVRMRVEASEGDPIARQDEAELAARLDLGGERAVLFASERRGGGPFGDEDHALLRVLARSAERWLAPPPAPVVIEAPAPEPPPAAAPESAAGADEAELLRAIADGMTRETVPERLLAASLRPIARATSARVASVYLIDNVTGRLVCEAQCEGTDVDRGALPRDTGLTGTSLQSGAIVATDHPERDPRFDAAVDTPESGAAGPLIVVPLRVRDRVLGLARIFPSGDGNWARLAELVAAPLSAATRNVLLYRSLLESVEDVARARREAEGKRQVSRSEP